jgi:hypothetical protein
MIKSFTYKENSTDKEWDVIGIPYYPTPDRTSKSNAERSGFNFDEFVKIDQYELIPPSEPFHPSGKNKSDLKEGEEDWWRWKARQTKQENPLLRMGFPEADIEELNAIAPRFPRQLPPSPTRSLLSPKTSPTRSLLSPKTSPTRSLLSPKDKRLLWGQRTQYQPQQQPVQPPITISTTTNASTTATTSTTITNTSTTITNTISTSTTCTTTISTTTTTISTTTTTATTATTISITT